MTCIIGYAKNKVVHIIGDSIGISGLDKTVRKDAKVFKIGDQFLVGAAGSFRALQVMQYDFQPPAKHDGITDMQYLVSYFINELRSVLKDKGVSFISENEEGVENTSFILGFNGNVYCVESDFQVSHPADNVYSIGCGSSYALGAFDALSSVKDAKRRLIRSMDITLNRCAGVSKPYVYDKL